MSLSDGHRPVEIGRAVARCAEGIGKRIVSVIQTGVLAPLLPVAIGTFSRSGIVIASSGLLVVAGVFLPLWPHRLANFVLLLLVWIAALLAALAGLRSRTAEKRIISLEQKVGSLQERLQENELESLRSVIGKGAMGGQASTNASDPQSGRAAPKLVSVLSGNEETAPAA